LVVVPLRVELLNVAAVEEDFAFLGVVEPLNEGNDGGFAAAGGATEGDDAVFLVVDG
jgi:hypothetical protein